MARPPINRGKCRIVFARPLPTNCIRAGGYPDPPSPKASVPLSVQSPVYPQERVGPQPSPRLQEWKGRLGSGYPDKTGGPGVSIRSSPPTFSGEHPKWWDMKTVDLLKGL